MNIEDSVRLTLHEFLHEVALANTCAGFVDGAQTLARLGADIERGMVNNARGMSGLTDAEREEWRVNAATICQRFFAKAEERRGEIAAARTRQQAGPGQ